MQASDLMPASAIASLDGAMGAVWGRALSASGSDAGSGDGSCASGCTLAACTIAGVVIHVLGSVGINIGQNLQALAIANGEVPGCGGSSKMWKIGMALFAVASIITFSALALASASILVPLESIQFIVNIAFNGIVRKKKITLKMYTGTAVIIGGVVLVVLFGTNEEAQAAACYTEAQLREYWTEPAWWVFLISSLIVAAVTYVVWRIYEKAGREKRQLPYHSFMEPVMFTLSSALFGGGQMVVHTKLLAELLELSGATGDVAMADWFFWVELIIVIVSGGYWLFRLTQCLGMFDPLLIIPLMQTAFMILGAIAGGIFFKEFDHLEQHPAGAQIAWIMYIFGILCSVAGLFLIAPPSDDEGPPYDNATASKPAEGVEVKGNVPAAAVQSPVPAQGESAVVHTSVEMIDSRNNSPSPSPPGPKEEGDGKV